MLIGILSMQKVNNYGSFWQALLLKRLFEQSGNIVEFIDIVPGRIISEHPVHKFDIKKIRYYIFFRESRKRMFEKFQKTYFACAKHESSLLKYDCIIIGSDEVFNFAQPVKWGFSPQLHGAIENKNVNSYAASFGASTYEDVERYGVREELVKASSNLKYISVRDENSEQIIKRLLPNAKIERHLDPVLVGDLPVPKRQKVKKKYILVYAYDYRFNDKEYINAIMKYARTKELKVYAVGNYQTWVDKNINVDPYQLLQYFINAECVVTDTFHGSIFSVRCHKPFVTVIRDGQRGNRQKLTSLLHDLHLESHQLERAEDFEKIISSAIEYYSIDTMLLNERKRTEEYLKMCLDEDEKPGGTNDYSM